MRLRFRYSLRTFLLVLVAMTTALGLWTRRSLDQQQQVRLLEGIGLHVIYDLEQARKEGALYKLRAWLAAMLGKDWVVVPIEVRASNEFVCIYAEDLAVLGKLRWVRTVDLHLTNADDEGIAQVARLPRLEVLNVGGTLMTEKGLSLLEKCHSLRELTLGESLIPQAAAEEFGRRHPTCQVAYTGALRRSFVNNKRDDALRADRAPTPEEKVQLDVSVGILLAEDNLEKIEVLAQFDPEWQRNRPKPGSREFQDWREEVENQPPDWMYLEAIDSLGKLGLAAAIPALERVARDTSLDDSRRNGAIGALALIADRRIVPILVDLLEDRTESVPLEALDRLESTTGQRFGVWNTDPDSQSRRDLVNRWRRYWKENGDVVRPRRAAGFTIH